jgi:hypothetical protein
MRPTQIGDARAIESELRTELERELIRARLEEMTMAVRGDFASCTLNDEWLVQATRWCWKGGKMSIVIVHVSDLHFDSAFLEGRQNPATLPPPPPPAVPPALPPGIQGLRHHDPVVCHYLCNRLRRLDAKWRSQRALKLLAVTGDLTVKGDDGEFSQAITFLRGEVATNWTDRLGLGAVQFDHSLAVPGNHDHWGGGTWAPLKAFAYWRQNGIHGTFFPSGPGHTWWFREYQDPGNEFVLQVMGLDSCAGPMVHAFARGSVDPNDVAGLEREILASNQRHQSRDGRKRIARLLMIHHGVNMPRNVHGAVHSLDGASVALVQRLQALDVRLLTGHLHGPLLSAQELRCGTTLQQAPNAGQSFLTHKLAWEANNGLQLHSRVFQRSFGGAFTRVSELKQAI